jgi:hypothetical protein
MSIIDSNLHCENIYALLNKLNGKCDFNVLIQSLGIIKESFTFSGVNPNDIEKKFKNKMCYLLNHTLNNCIDLFLAIIFAVYKGFPIYRLPQLVDAYSYGYGTKYFLTDNNDCGNVNSSILCALYHFHPFEITSLAGNVMMSSCHLNALKSHFSTLENNGSLTKAAIKK